MEATMSGYLQPELLSEIFSKLPSKTLLRFQCVSISIRAMIIDPTFVLAHHNWSASNQRGYLMELISTDHQTLTLSCLDDQKFFVSETLMKVPADLPNFFNISTCCFQSLFSFTGLTIEEEQIIPCTYLCNPSIRVYKKLPDSSSFSDLGINSIYNYECLCGLGFDSHTNDYKLIQIICESLGNAFQNVYRMNRVYSLNKSSWRSCTNQSEKLLHDFSPLFTTWSTSLNLNGVFYWVSYCDDSEIILKFSIMRFSFCDETFRKIELPSSYDGKEIHYLDIHIGSFEESLALFIGNSSVRLWVLNQVSEGGGIGSSWTSKFNVYLAGTYLAWPISFGLNKNHLLFVGRHNRILYVWDVKKQKCEGFITDDVTDVFSYSESLVLLNHGRI